MTRGGHPVRAWEARYPGVCPACGGEIRPGQQVIRTGAGVAHNGGCTTTTVAEGGRPC